MWSKVFAPLLPNRLAPAQKFPQLKLRPQQHRLLTHKRQCDISLTSFDANSVEFARREIASGSIVEIRDSDRHQLLALGFYEPTLLRVDVFHMTSQTVSELPIIDEEFFLNRLREAWEKRRRVFGSMVNGDNNTYRVLNGTADGIPSMYVDLYSSSFARIVATSFGAERLVPAVSELLRRQGSEQLLLDTPCLKDREKLTLVHPTIPLSAVYVENGTRHLWVPSAEVPATRSNRWLLNPAHRRIRFVLREVCRGKRVLCVNDRSGSAALNAVMSAKSVLIAESDGALVDRVRENLVSNHTSSVFNVCETTICARIEDLDARRQDVVYLEHHPDQLSSEEEWRTTLSALLRRRICGVGTLLFVAQEAAPLGISDLLQQHFSDAHAVPAQRDAVAAALRAAASEHNLNLRQLRVFGPSVDYPILPTADALCFSQLFLLEKNY
ncbi:23S rRNA (cytosine1962-C5)-methyltransferase [Trypanosoma rangeli]|uniref:23S rRNA (Cytosine1962-C5)-methyltransferase n=1 Tax=Trypanosoma rangeli TaxID=5698 RepID=A0A422NW63_TRYRA|nr:23S rRNA (cytosine1962-C5)-methyltransferase [Trypanosoma rangeli]RNF09727.1 23S rRNA (cytosine1962-C5)-methyltransferase [Trypanosoma rangeli]|eukprot:RNF09727.1 23S rRNA (cytosine1962-C5)-methyltransferase [Trypanosoma rangeli]